MNSTLSKKAIHIADLFEQIDAVNKMIALHADDAFMEGQYVHRKKEFVKQLKDYLREFDIQLTDAA